MLIFFLQCIKLAIYTLPLFIYFHILLVLFYSVSKTVKMGTEWLKNMCGMSLTDEQMETVPYTTTELVIHVTTKTVQAFGLLGTTLVGPIAAVLKKETRNLPGIKHKMTRAGRGGLILGLATGPLMTYMKIKNEEEYKIWDRCYRLRHNRGQVRVDQYSFVGAVAGAGVGVAAGSGALFGGLVGMSSGILLSATVTNVINKPKN